LPAANRKSLSLPELDPSCDPPNRFSLRPSFAASGPAGGPGKLGHGGADLAESPLPLRFEVAPEHQVLVSGNAKPHVVPEFLFELSRPPGGMAHGDQLPPRAASIRNGS